MKILLINKYFYIKGGAENSFFQMATLLKNKGHQVCFFSMASEKNFDSEYSPYFISNVNYDDHSIKNIIKCSGRMIYSWEARKSLDKLIEQEKPDIAHLNNIYHQLSPSILHSLKKAGIPVVMSLRDYKIVCGSYAMLLDGKVCEACKGGKHYHCLLNKCVKDSRVKSFLNTFEMYLHHKVLNIYNLVDTFISPSRFLKAKVREMGLKRDVEHLFNFVNLDEFEPEYQWSERSIIYFGRVSPEKGIATLIRAMKGLNGVTLKIIGDGPARAQLEQMSRDEGIDNVRFCGYMSGADLYDEIKRCMFTALPSEWYENNPRNVIEAFGLGKPAVAAGMGGIPELVIDNQTGFLYQAGNVEELRDKLSMMISDPDLIIRLGKNARQFVEDELNEEKHYEGLMKIYNNLLEKKRTAAHG